jgi:hypothetical protein
MFIVCRFVVLLSYTFVFRVCVHVSWISRLEALFLIVIVYD